MDDTEAVCDRIGIIHHGKLNALGSVEELADQVRAPGSHLEDVFLKLTLESEGEGKVSFSE
jgi:ABC-2 type transport system ATP-binding protein